MAIRKDFYSLEEYLKYASRGEYDRCCSTYAPSGWWGNITGLADAVDKVRRMDAADPGVMTKVNQVIAKLNEVTPQSVMKEWTHGYEGSRPNVQKYLHGDARNMRRKVVTESDRAPVRIFVELGYNSGTSTDAIANKGAAVIALATRLQATRSVEIIPLQNGRMNATEVICALHMETKPINMAYVTTMIASIINARRIRFNILAAILRENGKKPSSAIGPVYSNTSMGTRRDRLIAELGIDKDHDILLSRDDAVDNDLRRIGAVAWVNKQLERYT